MPKKKSSKEINKQLSLGLKTPFTNFFDNLRNRIITKLMFFQANKFINDPLVWLFSMLMSVSAIFQLFFLLNKITDLPSFIPIFRSATDPGTSLFYKIYILFIPTTSLLLFIITFRFARSNYYKNTDLSHYTLFISTLLITILSYYIIRLVTAYV